MFGRQANTLSPDALNRTLAHVRRTAFVERDTAIILCRSWAETPLIPGVQIPRATSPSMGTSRT